MLLKFIAKLTQLFSILTKNIKNYIFDVVQENVKICQNHDMPNVFLISNVFLSNFRQKFYIRDANAIAIVNQCLNNLKEL